MPAEGTVNNIYISTGLPSWNEQGLCLSNVDAKLALIGTIASSADPKYEIKWLSKA